MTILLNNVDTDQDSADYVSSGGKAVIHVRASVYGGATVEIQSRTINDDSNRYATLPNGNFTGNGTITLDYVPNGMFIRAKLSSTTGPTDGVFVDVLP